MNENMNTDQYNTPDMNGSNMGNSQPVNEAPKEKKDVRGFFEGNCKLLGGIAACVLAILMIITCIFVICASANISRMTKQQMDLNKKTEALIDQTSSLYGNGMFGNAGTGENGESGFSGNINLDDLIDLFSQGGSSDQSSNNGGTGNIDLGELGDLIGSLFGN